MAEDASTRSLLIVAPPSAERSALRELASRLNARAHLADNAVMGFGVLVQARPTLTIADAQMRPTDAITFVREVRNTPIANCDAPIWIMTRGEPDQLSIAAEDVGADGVVRVPISESGLRTLLRRADAARALAHEGCEDAPRHAPDRAVSQQVRAGIERLLVEADAAVAAWSRSGLDPNLVTVETSLDTAAQLAVRAGDPDLLHALTVSLRIVDESRRMWDGDDRRIRAAINDVRFLLAPSRRGL